MALDGHVQSVGDNASGVWPNRVTRPVGVSNDDGSSQACIWTYTGMGHVAIEAKEKYDIAARSLGSACDSCEEPHSAIAQQEAHVYPWWCVAGSDVVRAFWLLQ